jgi:hypothetical protein
MVMPIALELTLIGFLLAISAGLVPLLYQLRGTARELSAFLLSSRKDIAQIAEDVHSVRLRVDHLAESLQVSLDELAVLARLAGELGSTVKTVHARFQCILESTSRNLGGIIGGISAVLALFKSRPTHSKAEQEP